MKAIKFFIIIFIQIGFLQSSIARSQNDTITAQKIINNAIEAMGGKTYLLSVKTMYTDMNTEMEGRKVHWIVREMLPNKGSFQIVYNGRIMFQNWFDGVDGFQSLNGKTTKAAADDFKDKVYKKNIFDELDYLDPTLYKLEMIGNGSVNDENCYKIKATLVNGIVKILYYSQSTFYMLREDKVANAEKDSFETTLFYGYKKYGQLTYYGSMKMGTDDKAQVATVSEIVVNDRVNDLDFKN